MLIPRKTHNPKDMGDDKKEELLFELRISKQQAESEVNQYTKAIEVLAAETRDLIAINDTLKKSGEVLGSTYSENTKQIEANKQKISEEQTARKALVTVIGSEENSIKALVAQNKLLIQERNSLSTKTEEGRSRIDALNKAIDANNQAIKANVSGLEKQRANIGDYSGALDKLVPGLGSTIEGMKGITKQALAFIATPIGAVVGALGLGLAALIQYFHGSEEGQDRFNKIMQVGGVIMEKITDLVEFVGKRIFETLGPAFEFVGNLISGVASAIGVDTKAVADFFDEVDARAEQFASNERKRNAALRELTVLRSKTESEVSELIIKAQEAEGQAKLTLVNKSIALRKNLLDKELEYTKLGLDAAKLAVEDDPTIENKQKEAEAIAALYKAQVDYNEGIRKLNAQRIASEKEVLDQLQSERDIARANEHLADKDADEQGLIQKTDIKLREVKLGLDAAKALLTTRKVTNEEYTKIAANQDQLDLLYMQAKLQRLETVSQAFGNSMKLFKEGTIAYRVTASAQAVVDTYRAAVAALAPPPIGVGPILGPIFAGIAISTGLASVAKINGVKFERGGQARGFTIGGRSHSAGGTKFWGEDGSQFEAEADEGLFILKRDAHRDWINKLSKQNESFNGVSWSATSTRYAALGGNINLGPSGSPSASDLIDIVGANTEQLLRSLPPTVVSVEDINRAQYEKSARVQFSQVL